MVRLRSPSVRPRNGADVTIEANKIISGGGTLHSFLTNPVPLADAKAAAAATSIWRSMAGRARRARSRWHTRCAGTDDRARSGVSWS